MFEGTPLISDLDALLGIEDQENETVLQSGEVSSDNVPVAANEDLPVNTEVIRNYVLKVPLDDTLFNSSIVSLINAIYTRYFKDYGMYALLFEAGYNKAIDMLNSDYVDPTKNLFNFLYTGVRHTMQNYVRRNERQTDEIPDSGYSAEYFVSEVPFCNDEFVACLRMVLDRYAVVGIFLPALEDSILTGLFPVDLNHDEHMALFVAGLHYRKRGLF